MVQNVCRFLRKSKAWASGSQVELTGIKSGSDLARYLARHRVMAVPSRCEEGFGIVALEGIACGCVVVGTNLGGLPEAIGPVGIVVPNGDSGARSFASATRKGGQHARASALPRTAWDVMPRSRRNWRGLRF